MIRKLKHRADNPEPDELPPGLDAARVDGVLYPNRKMARWAIFLKTLGVSFAVKLRDGRDFTGPTIDLVELNCHLIICPCSIDEGWREFAKRLAMHGGTCAFITDDFPTADPSERPSATNLEAYVYKGKPELEHHTSHWFCICPDCGFVDICKTGIVAGIQCPCKHKPTKKNIKRQTFNAPSVQIAASLAMNWKFPEDEIVDDPCDGHPGLK